MPRIYTPPAKLDIRKNLARDALVLYAGWQVTGSRDDAPVLIGKLASSLELLLQALGEAGL
jgi:hypothetical protein